MVALSQKTLLAQQDNSTGAPTVESQSKILKKIKHKNKKRLKEGDKKIDLREDKKAKVKQALKTNKEEKEEIENGLDAKGDK
jgi:hypothetical protein